MKPIHLVIMMLIPGLGHADLIVSVTEPPPNPNGRFEVVLSGANGSDKRPNPCYHRDQCTLRYMTIDESWLPDGRADYVSVDTGWDQEYPDALYDTIGAWVERHKKVGDLYRSGADFLPEWSGRSPCVVVAAAYGRGMIEGTIVSNCAKGVVQAPTCRMTPENINLSTTITAGTKTENLGPDTPIQISCTNDANVVIETNSGEKVPLDGQSEFYALLDWGAGYGNPGKYKVVADKASTVRLRASIKGAENADPGVHHGTAIVNVSYE